MKKKSKSFKTVQNKDDRRRFCFIKENCLCNYVDGGFVIFVDAKKNLCLKDLNGYKYRTVVRCVKRTQRFPITPTHFLFCRLSFCFPSHNWQKKQQLNQNRFYFS